MLKRILGGAAVLTLAAPIGAAGQTLFAPNSAFLAATIPAAAAQQGGQQRGGVRFVWGDHPSLRFGRALRLDFVAKLQEDARKPGDTLRRLDDDPLVLETWELHRLRVGIDGEVFNRVQFSIERELYERETEEDPSALTDKTQWKDVYVDANITTALQVRAGRFKIPFGGETLTGISNLDFIYRTLGSNYLTPSRDVGVALHGRVFDDGLSYWVGGFQHDGDNSKSKKIQGGDRTLAGRVTLQPWNQSRGPGVLEISAALARTEVSDESVLPNGLRGRTVMSQYTFYEPVFAKGYRTRFQSDVEFRGGPFFSRAELIWLSDDRLEQGFGSDDLPQARARSWYFSGGAVLTGERKNRRVEPDHWFGAVEVAGRLERIRFAGVPGDDIPFRNPRAVTILPVSNQVATAGINWYITRWVKLQINAIREQIDDDERNPVTNGAAFWSRIFRLQLAL